jgi:hypothetical protein
MPLPITPAPITPTRRIAFAMIIPFLEGRAAALLPWG